MRMSAGFRRRMACRILAAFLSILPALPTAAQKFYPTEPALTGKEFLPLAYPNTLGPLYTTPGQIAAYIGQNPPSGTWAAICAAAGVTCPSSGTVATLGSNTAGDVLTGTGTAGGAQDSGTALSSLLPNTGSGATSAAANAILSAASPCTQSGTNDCASPIAVDFSTGALVFGATVSQNFLSDSIDVNCYGTVASSGTGCQLPLASNEWISETGSDEPITMSRSRGTGIATAGIVHTSDVIAMIDTRVDDGTGIGPSANFTGTISGTTVTVVSNNSAKSYLYVGQMISGAGISNSPQIATLGTCGTSPTASCTFTITQSNTVSSAETITAGPDFPDGGQLYWEADSNCGGPALGAVPSKVMLSVNDGNLSSPGNTSSSSMEIGCEGEVDFFAATAGSALYAHGGNITSYQTTSGQIAKVVAYNAVSIGVTTEAGELDIYSLNASNATRTFFEIKAVPSNITSGSEAGNNYFYGYVGGAQTRLLQLGALGGIVVGSSGTDEGTGNLNITGTYYDAGTAGVTCSGTPTSSFAATGGIVTHC